MQEQNFQTHNLESFLLLKNLLTKTGSLEIKISGKSMLPLIQNTDKIKIQPMLNISDLKRFDIVVFWQRDILICHYFWKKNIFLETQGDHHILQTRPLNPITGYDFPTEFSKILGIVTNFRIGNYLKLKIIFLVLLKKLISKFSNV